MIRPMPFWPSLEPWAKDTPVQVSIRMLRIHNGGASLFFGASNSWRFLITTRSASSSSAAAANPTSGESSSDSPILVTCVQSTPLVPLRPCISALATPTPTIEPISVWDEEAGSPSHQEPRFQMMAAINSANTIAKPALEPTCRISSTGSNEMMPKATAPLETSTPQKLNKPDHSTATCGGSEWV